jgi:hypothetical protein
LRNLGRIVLADHWQVGELDFIPDVKVWVYIRNEIQFTNLPMVRQDDTAKIAEFMQLLGETFEHFRLGEELQSGDDGEKIDRQLRNKDLPY